MTYLIICEKVYKQCHVTIFDFWFLQDFAEMSRLIGESDGKTVDHFAGDLVDSSVEGDVYSAINKDWRPFPFGKGLTHEKGTSTFPVELINKPLKNNKIVI